MKTKISIIVVILVSMAFIMKLSQHENHEDGDHQENVTFIHNDDSAWGDTPQIKLELSRTIGGLDNIDENYYFYNPTDFAFDDSGYLYVADSGNNRIQKYDKNGKYIATFGRKGQGPGEFTSVDALNIAKNGNIYALDSGQNRMIILSPEGKEISRFELERAYGNFELNSRNNTIKQTFEYDGKLMHILDTDGKEIVKFLDQIDTKDRDIKKYNRYFSFTVDKDENIFVAYNLRNLIEKYTPSGELLMKFDRKLEYEESEEIKYNEKVIRDRTIKLAEYNTISAGITIDEKGRIWVLRMKRQLNDNEVTVQSVVAVSSPGGPTKIVEEKTHSNSDIAKTDAYMLEIYDSDGYLQGNILLDHFCGTIKIFKDRLYIMDSQRAICIYEYKIIE